jgi:Tfp pilus assembly PilM family ATPase
MVAEILDDLFLPTLDHLTEEVEKSLAYYASESQGEMLELLILAGGGAKLRNLDVFLSERLGLAVRILGSSLDNEAAPGPGVDWPHMAEALGLSFRGLGSTTWKSLRGQGP